MAKGGMKLLQDCTRMWKWKQTGSYMKATSRLKEPSHESAWVDWAYSENISYVSNREEDYTVQKGIQR